jgi:hypothetical protein
MAKNHLFQLLEDQQPPRRPSRSSSSLFATESSQSLKPRSKLPPGPTQSAKRHHLTAFNKVGSSFTLPRMNHGGSDKSSQKPEVRSATLERNKKGGSGNANRLKCNKHFTNVIYNCSGVSLRGCCDSFFHGCCFFYFNTVTTVYVVILVFLLVVLLWLLPL